MLQALCALLVIAGLFLLLRINPADVVGWLTGPIAKHRRWKERIRRITGKPKGRLVRTVDNAREMLIASDMGRRIGTYQWTAVVLAAAGLFIGLALNNVPTALVLAVGLGASPLIVIRIRTGDYLRSLHERLESAMGVVTNSYLASSDLIGAAQSNLRLLPAPLDGIFRQFLAEAQLVDSDVGKALRHMRERIDNRYWHDWCDVLLQCRRDRQLRFALPGIVSRLGEMRRAQLEADTAIQKEIGDYLVTVLIVVGSIPLMGAMMPDWYAMLTTTPAGKLTLAIVLAAVLGASMWVAQLYRPVEGGGKP